MKITIIAPGKLKEDYLREAQAHFTRILSKNADFEVIEVPDERNDAGDETVKRIEGERILKKISPGQYVIALAIDGTPLTSDRLKEKLQKLCYVDRKDVVFVIGGSLGLSGEVLSRADYRLSFSPMTFPHQVMRIMLMETLAALHL